MKKVVRLTEADLTRIVKRVISEQVRLDRGQDEAIKKLDDAKNFFIKKYPEVIKMADYADRNMSHRNYTGVYYDKDDKGYYVTTTPTLKNKIVDDEFIKFSVLNNGTTKVEFIQQYGVDPTPIPIPKSFEAFKKWFDSVGIFG